MRGMEVTVLHLMPTLMERQLDPVGRLPASEKTISKSAASTSAPKANTHAIVGDGKVEGVQLDDGTDDPGRASWSWRSASVPARRWPRRPGMEVNRGILVDAHDADLRSRHLCGGRMRRGRSPACATAWSRRCTRWRKRHRPQRLDRRRPRPRFTGIRSPPTKLKVTGIDLLFAGEFADGADREEIVVRDALGRHLQAAGSARTTGSSASVLYGDTSDGPWFFNQSAREGRPTFQRDARDPHLRPA